MPRWARPCHTGSPQTGPQHPPAHVILRQQALERTVGVPLLGYCSHWQVWELGLGADKLFRAILSIACMWTGLQGNQQHQLPSDRTGVKLCQARSQHHLESVKSRAESMTSRENMGIPLIDCNSHWGAWELGLEVGLTGQAAASTGISVDWIMGSVWLSRSELGSNTYWGVLEPNIIHDRPNQYTAHTDICNNQDWGQVCRGYWGLLPLGWNSCWCT